MNGDNTALVADPDMPGRTHTVQMLFQMGLKVLYAESAERAIVIAERYRDTIHLLIAAVDMPDMSGEQLAVRLQATRPGMRVLYISDHTTDDPNGHSGDDTGFLPRPPFSRQQLAAQIADLRTKSHSHLDYAR